jgi:hypothetical protein
MTCSPAVLEHTVALTLTLLVQAPQWMADDSDGFMAVLREAAQESNKPHPGGLVSAGFATGHLFNTYLADYHSRQGK